MEFKRLPLLNLDNQYTYLRGEQKKKQNPLLGFSEQLFNMNKLPSIDKKHTRTTRRIDKELQQVSKAIQQHKRRFNLPSQNRYQKPKMIPYYVPLPVNIPQMNMSMFLPQMQSSNICPHQSHQSTQKPVTNPTPSPNPPPIVQNITNVQKIEQKKPQAQVKKEEPIKKYKQIIKFPEKSKINRFRVAAYAVYFSIYVKHFAKKFTELRRNWFNQRYAINQGKIILEGSTKILRHLHEIDIYKMILTSKQRLKEIDLDDGKVGHSKTPDNVLALIHFVTLIIDYAKEYMTNHSFILEHHEVFTVGLLTQNFMLTNLYLPQQAAILHIHPQGYIQVEEQTEIILLMIKIIVKIIVYNYLLSLKYSRQWNAKQEKSHGLDESDMEELWSMTRNAGVFLSIVCEQIYDKTYQQMSNSIYKYNFNEMSPKLNILPAKALEEARKPKGNANPNDANSKLIVNLQGYSDMQVLINAYPPLKKFKEKIKLKIIDFLTVIYTSLKYQQAKVYDFVRNLAIQQKYIIMKGVKQDMLNKKKKKKEKKKKNKEQKNQKNQKHRKGRKSRKSNNNRKSGKDDQQNRNKDQQQSQNENNNKNQRNDQGQNRSRHQSEENSEDSSDSSQDQNNHRKKKKLRFKHEQLFYDNKFDGYHKLQKLKEKVKRK